MSTPDIASLIEVNRYNPNVLPQLEAHVASQIENNSYDIEANLCVLKLYQFYPEKANLSVIARILVKALMQLPETGFQMSLCLIPEKLQEEEAVSTLSQLHTYLETCQFKAFWESASSTQDILGAIPGFDAAIRSYIAGVFAITFQSTEKSFVMEALNVTDESTFSAFAGSSQWQIEGDTVRFPANDFNQAKAKMFSETIGYERMAKILSTAR